MWGMTSILIIRYQKSQKTGKIREIGNFSKFLYFYFFVKKWKKKQSFQKNNIFIGISIYIHQNVGRDMNINNSS